jgi:2-dehydro-3-deoxyphosphogluconate aldolase/(4S)-4-hydroxy-2-oxoglutarate aldolase
VTAQGSIDSVLERFAAERCSAILRTPHKEAVEPAMRAAVDAGFRIVEFTLNTPGALQHIKAFAEDDRLLVGAGTVLSIEDAEQAVAAGARFLVSPVIDTEVVQWCAQRGLVSIPGVATPTEALMAWRAGAPLQKVFPGPPGGPSWVHMVRGPMPFLRLFPTSGVELGNVAEYLAAGAYGVGFVNTLFDPGWLAAGRFENVRERAEQLLAAVRECRGP